MHDKRPQLLDKELADAWQKALPETLNKSDSCKVVPDDANPQRLLITIETAGHQAYSFDFSCEYADESEVMVELMDVECGGLHIDERAERVQQLIEDYVRHIHECAQVLQKDTQQS